MPENPAPELLEEGAGLEEIRQAAVGCRACHPYRDATQTVFGDGPPDAPVMVVGEQPGAELRDRPVRRPPPPGCAGLAR